MEESVGLPGDSPIRERIFNTGLWGGDMTQRKLQPAFVCMKKFNSYIMKSPLDCVKIFTPLSPEFIFYIYSHSIAFHKNSLLNIYLPVRY